VIVERERSSLGENRGNEREQWEGKEWKKKKKRGRKRPARRKVKGLLSKFSA